MTPTEAWRRIKEARHFYLFLLLVGFTGATCLFFGNVFLQKLGEAFIVASFLAGSVDLYLKSRLAKEVVKDISPFLMAYHIPETLRDEVSEICRIEYYRSNFELSYELSEIPGRPGYLSVKAITSYDVINLVDSYTKYTHYVWVEKSIGLERQIGKVSGAGVFGLDREPSDYIEDGQESATEEPGAVVWTKQVLIPPKGNPPARFWDTSFEILSVERSEPMISMAAVVGARVRVSNPEWLDVRVSFEHRLGEKCHLRQKNRTLSVWEFEHALLPYSTILVVWQPKEKSPSLTLQDEPAPPSA